ncbi:MAG TPA: hypothetical protein VNZ64_03925 [Candidatus Acidoferrum sp.]|jgi:hypothetical protein|nr:hypothetical protein [Candidatus Acidoferrum sp.]
MNTNHEVQVKSNAQRRESRAKTVTAACVKACRSLLHQLQSVKEAVMREFESPKREQGQMLQSALNEAEALAWQTPYPHLLFPVLAREKAESARQWAERQRDVRKATLAFAE